MTVPEHQTREWQLVSARRFLEGATTNWGKRFWQNEIARLEAKAPSRNRDALK